MGPEVREYNVGGGRVEAYYFCEAGVSAMAVQPDIPEESRRAREVEAYGHHVKPPRKGEKFCLFAHSAEDIDPVSVRALQRVVEYMEPDWATRVKEEYEFYGDDLASIIFWSGVPPEPAKAILENMNARGELPEHPS